jgi:hypothetical protein
MTILALGIIGIILSALYQQQNELILTPLTVKVSYGFPLSWHGYLEQTVSLDGKVTYWYSVEFLLIDTAFWFASSSSICVATLKLVNILHRARASGELSQK